MTTKTEEWAAALSDDTCAALLTLAADGEVKITSGYEKALLREAGRRIAPDTTAAPRRRGIGSVLLDPSPPVDQPDAGVISAVVRDPITIRSTTTEADIDGLDPTEPPPLSELDLEPDPTPPDYDEEPF